MIGTSDVLALHRAEASFGTKRALTAFCEALFWSAAGPPPAERIAWTVADLSAFIATAGRRARWMLGLVVLVVAWLVPLLVLRPGPVWWLDPALRNKALERAERTPLGPAVHGLKIVACMIYYEHREQRALQARSVHDHASHG